MITKLALESRVTQALLEDFSSFSQQVQTNLKEIAEKLRLGFERQDLMQPEWKSPKHPSGSYLKISTTSREETRTAELMRRMGLVAGPFQETTESYRDFYVLTTEARSFYDGLKQEGFYIPLRKIS